jgi:hypothetical protein
MGLDFLVPIFGILVVLVPIIGVTTVLTLRFGIKPFIETLAGEMKGTSYGASPELQLQVADLSEQVAVLSAELRRVKEAQDFDERLLEGRTEAAAAER